MTDDYRIHLLKTYCVHQPSPLQEHPHEDPVRSHILQMGKATLSGSHGTERQSWARTPKLVCLQNLGSHGDRMAWPPSGWAAVTTPRKHPKCVGFNPTPLCGDLLLMERGCRQSGGWLRKWPIP